jgi:hypothetical protein
MNLDADFQSSRMREAIKQEISSLSDKKAIASAMETLFDKPGLIFVHAAADNHRHIVLCARYAHTKIGPDHPTMVSAFPLEKASANRGTFGIHLRPFLHDRATSHVASQLNPQSP